MKPGFNTNGLAFHRWDDALRLIAETGYTSAAITVDHYTLNPFAPDLPQQMAAMQHLLQECQLSTVIETGARFLLDPRVKHEPTLVSSSPEERDRRIDFLKRCVDLAAALQSDAVSFWAGQLKADLPRVEALNRLAAGCREVIDYAADKEVRLAFEPEPGMLIETLADFEELLTLVDHPCFGLTVDIGHLQCMGELPISEYLKPWRERIFNIHIEDMRQGEHDHLRFGEGEIDFDDVFAGLRQIDYQGGLHVELSRHSHMAPDVLRESFAFLQQHLQTG
ncbi:sugar phosphate isomerase/epimerase [Gimesia chilikensis]|uniref:sugar phosphate isomerase/epimerase family protein n=1 Tax=Gimesia chilikensis TaxID=2605989 RepID=UPI0011EF3D2F|nr:sugar phosphate isomerase/epimerase family protein [Gimesia chilikensis]KAA0140626.1 sugar phosphate isomerase/epimerase [Gimesia chilikensis]